MKYLSDYLQEKQTALFEKHGVFFAFNRLQFEEQRVGGVEYYHLPAGMCCPKDSAKQFFIDHEKVVNEAIAQDIAENGKKAIIHRELGNYETQITNDISDAVAALSRYGITEQGVKEEFDEFYQFCVEHDYF